MQKLKLIQQIESVNFDESAAILADFENAMASDFSLWWLVGERFLGAAKHHGGALAMVAVSWCTDVDLDNDAVQDLHDQVKP